MVKRRNCLIKNRGEQSPLNLLWSIMKTLLLSIVLMIGVIAPAHAFNGTIGRSTVLNYAGAVVSESVEKQFINIKNTGASALLAGQVVSADLVAKDGASAAISATAGKAPLCINVNACAAGALCKCQTYGVFSAALFDSTGANSVAGNRWYMSTNNAGYLSARATSLATEVPGGIFYDAASASGSVAIFISL
jgi:hypothetical protein